MDTRLLSQKWQKITGDSYIVKVKRVSGGVRGIKSACKELFKYVTKGLVGLGVEEIEVLAKYLKNKRIVNAFGTCARWHSDVVRMVCPVCGNDSFEFVKECRFEDKEIAWVEGELKVFENEDVEVAEDNEDWRVVYVEQMVEFWKEELRGVKLQKLLKEWWKDLKYLSDIKF